MKGKVKHGTKLVAQQRDKSFVVCSINQTVREDPGNKNKQLKPVFNETGSPGEVMGVQPLKEHVRVYENSGQFT